MQSNYAALKSPHKTTITTEPHKQNKQTNQQTPRTPKEDAGRLNCSFPAHAQ